MINLWQDLSPIDINNAWEISPYNSLGYGALVMVIGAVAWYFMKLSEKNMKLAEKKQEYIDTLVGKIHELGDTTAHHLEDLSKNSHMQYSQNEKVIYILEDVKKRLDKIEKLDKNE